MVVVPCVWFTYNLLYDDSSDDSIFSETTCPFKLGAYPSSDRSGSTSHRIGLDLLTLTETQTLLRGSGYNKCTIKTSAAPSQQLVTKCGKCLCSGVKRRIGEVRVKSDRVGGGRKEWRHLETEADE